VHGANWVSYFVSLTFFILVVAFIVYLILTRRARVSGDRPQWNTYAIGAFALAPLVPVIPLAFGIIALAQISGSEDRGRALAIIAIVIQSIGVLGFIGYVALAVVRP
jgi:hypothetical protein